MRRKVVGGSRIPPASGVLVCVRICVVRACVCYLRECRVADLAVDECVKTKGYSKPAASIPYPAPYVRRARVAGAAGRVSISIVRRERRPHARRAAPQTSIAVVSSHRDGRGVCCDRSSKTWHAVRPTMMRRGRESAPHEVAAAHDGQAAKEPNPYQWMKRQTLRRMATMMRRNRAWTLMRHAPRGQYASWPLPGRSSHWQAAHCSLSDYWAIRVHPQCILLRRISRQQPDCPPIGIATCHRHLQFHLHLPYRHHLLLSRSHLQARRLLHCRNRHLRRCRVLLLLLLRRLRHQ